jgi:hypothetical protein
MPGDPRADLRKMFKTSPPPLTRPPLDDLIAPVELKPRGNSITMDPGQWDTLLQMAYDDGWVLLEMKNNIPVRAYQRSDHQKREGRSV